MKKIRFHDYVRYREGAPEDKFGMDASGDGDGELEKLNRFMLLAVSDQDIRGSLYPILHQIAGQDETGEMQDLLKRIDINALGKHAKQMLRMNKNNDQPEDGEEEREKQLDMVKPAFADSGRGTSGDEGGGGGGA
jgi:hypothetical protein